MEYKIRLKIANHGEKSTFFLRRKKKKRRKKKQENKPPITIKDGKSE
jgi:hypothetical protein